MDARRTILTRGTVYLPGQVHGFPPRTELALPTAIADALDAAGHTVPAEEIEQEAKAAEAAKPA